MTVAAIDQGTTSTRVMVVEPGGVARLVGQLTHSTRYPAPGWVEQDPAELLRNIRALLEKAGPVAALGLANQGESCLAWDAMTGEPLSPVLVWQDARTAAELTNLRGAAEQRSRQICGLPLDPYFSASKLGWLMRENPAVIEAQAAGRLRLGTTDAFFLQHLTGRSVTDLTTASRTGLLDLTNLRWSDELCALHGVPIDCLPPIAAEFGAVNGVPIAASVVDQQAALVGHGCRAPGDCKITFGTGAFLLAVCGRSRPENSTLLPTIGWTELGAPIFALEGGVYDAGSSLDWARGAGLFQSVDELDGFTGPSAISRGLAFVPALSGLAAPFWDRTAAPLFIGMDHATSREDLCRAVLEGIALLTAQLIEAAGAGPRISIDGGLSQNPAFAGFLAAATGREVVTLGSTEMTSIGLASLCGIDVSQAQRVASRCEPDGSVSEADKSRFARAVSMAQGWRG